MEKEVKKNKAIAKPIVKKESKEIKLSDGRLVVMKRMLGKHMIDVDDIMENEGVKSYKFAVIQAICTIEGKPLFATELMEMDVEDITTLMLAFSRF